MLCRACRQAGRRLPARPVSAVSLPSQSWPASTVSAASKTIHTATTATTATARTAAAPLLSRHTSPSASPWPSRLARPYSSSSASAPAATDTSPTSPTLAKPADLDEAESHIWDLLCEELAPVELRVQDISGGCGSMYGIDICSDKFRGANMLKQQRMVNAVLGDLVKGWHGVQLKTRVP